MAHGLACVVSDASPGLRALVRDGCEGLVVPPDNAAALADALDRLLRSPELRVRLGAAAHAKMGAQSAGSVIERWETILGLRAGRTGAI